MPNRGSSALTPGRSMGAKKMMLMKRINMKVGIYQDPNHPEQDREPTWDHPYSQGQDFEATNIAIHAQKVYNHFTVVCHVDAGKLQSYQHNEQQVKPGLRARAAKSGSCELHMGFNSAQSVHPKLIVFQTDGCNGLVVENGKFAHHPAYDPEVVYHEVAHGLMWLLNPAPFRDVTSSVPFGRALVEGYATYFARSIAQPPDPSPLWARAAYREEESPGVPAWCDRWALFRNEFNRGWPACGNPQPCQTWCPGLDKLPAPNLYPYQTTKEQLPIYDVGMVWARALWDLRSVLGAPQVDRLALEAYNYLHGWVANFELAAEGVIDAATRLNVPNQELPGIFAGRGILAAQSIQALLRASNAPLGSGQQGTVLLAGADAGLMRSTDDGLHWDDWDDLENGEKLKDVVALTVEGATFYAATENGIYRCASDGQAWSPVGEWPVDQAPYSMVAAGHRLYAGTGHGVWRYDLAGSNEKWVVSECTSSLNGVACTDCTSPSCPFDFLGLDLASAPVTAVNFLYSACFDAVRYRAATGQDWQTKSVGNPGDLAAVTAVAAQGNLVCLGTLTHGIYRMKMQMPVDLTPIAQKGDLGGGMVLTLALLGNSRAIAGTTAGLYVGDRQGGSGDWDWNLCPGLPDRAAVTVVLPVGDDILVSTATHGPRRWDGNGWNEVPDLKKLAGL